MTLLCALLQLPVLDQNAPGSDRLGFSPANQQRAGLGLSHLGGMSSDDLMGLSGPLPQQQGGSAGRLGEAEAVWAALAASSQAWPAVPTAVGRDDHREEGWATFPEVSQFLGRYFEASQGLQFAVLHLRVLWSRFKEATAL